VTAQPLPNRFDLLHDRLTVVSVPAVERATFAQGLARALTEDNDALDLRSTMIITRADIAAVAERLATERAPARAAAVEAAEAALKDALEAHDRAVASHGALTAEAERLEREAVRCDDVAAHADEIYAMVAVAAAQAAARRSDLDSARERLNRVIEQREAGRAAVAEAEREWAALAGAGLGELDLRRDLEAASRAAQDAAAKWQAATELSEALSRQRREIAETRSAIAAGRDAEQWAVSVAPDAMDRVAAALEVAEAGLAHAEPDPAARDLAFEIERSEHRLAAAQADASDPPSPDEVAAAEAAVVDARAREERLATAPSTTAEEWAALDAAHAAVVRAEKRAEHGFRRAAAHRALAEARQAERSLLDRHGWVSYLEVMITGGLFTAEQMSNEPASSLPAALDVLADLRARAANNERLIALENEHAQLVARAKALLGVDPGDQAVALLEAHRHIPVADLAALVAALEAVGVRPLGNSVVDTARAWLSDVRAAISLAAGLDNQIAELDARDAALAAAASAAAGEGESAAGMLESARRAANTMESELAARAGGDADRPGRTAEAHRLRNQIEAVVSALDGAETMAQGELDAAAVASSEADREWDRATGVMAAAGRRAHDLATALPPESRPTLGPRPLDGLSELADALRERARQHEHELALAADVMTRTTNDVDRAAAELHTSRALLDVTPQPIDLGDALTELLAAGRTRPTVFDADFEGTAPTARNALLAATVRASNTQQVVVLTDDADVLGWAIGLPLSVAAVTAAAALTIAFGFPPPSEPEPANDHATPVATAIRGRPAG